MIEKQLDTLKTRQILGLVFSYLLKRHSTRLRQRATELKNDLFYRPLGRIAVTYHAISDKLCSRMYDKGILKKPRDSLEVEFDRKTDICFNKILIPKLLTLCQEKEQGNSYILAVQNSSPCFSALGGYLYKDYINRNEFEISNFPYSKSFVGGSAVNSIWSKNLKTSFDKDFEKMILDSMDIDVQYSVSPNSHAYYSRGFINIAHWFTVIMMQNEQVDFFIERFLRSYMRLVHLEQRKLNVSSPYIANLVKKWEADLVQDFTLGVTLIGLSQYAVMYNSLPTTIRTRVPAFKARNSYERQGVYRPPIQKFEELRQ